MGASSPSRQTWAPRTGSEVGESSPAQLTPALVEAVSHSEKFVNILINNHGIFRGRANIGGPTQQTAEEVGRAMFDDVSWEDWCVSSQSR